MNINFDRIRYLVSVQKWQKVKRPFLAARQIIAQVGMPNLLFRCPLSPNWPFLARHYLLPWLTHHAKILTGKRLKHSRVCRIIVVFSMMHVALIFAQNTSSESSILILNTDKSVAKYSIAQTAFERSVKATCTTFDLESNWVGEVALKELIDNTEPDLIYCIGSRSSILASRLENNRPLVVSSVLNWQRIPFAGNVYGVANELTPKTQITMALYLFPKMTKIGVLYSKKYNEEWIQLATSEGRDRGIEIVSCDVLNSRDVSRNLKILQKKVDALWVIPDPMVMASRDQVLTIYKNCDLSKLPIFAHDPVYADIGAVTVIAVDIPTIGRQAAGLVDDILQGKPQPQRFQNPVGTKIIVNLKNIEKYGLKFNEKALGIVTRVIK